MAEPGFVFAVCQLGAEAMLKEEIAREHGELRFAYSRPGLVTWKRAGGVAPDVELRSVFARAFGESIGPAAGVEAVLAAARALGRPRLHVFERDAWRPGEEPADAGAAALAMRAEILAAADGVFLPDEIARPGDLVLDVIVSSEPIWLGRHRHGPTHARWPGGRMPVVLPADAPSRAYAKVEEAILWSGAPLAAGETAVEIGSAPGGASDALLRRGLHVIGVDPGAMDARILAHPRFRHVMLPVGALRLEELPERVAWMLMDVNLAPQVALHAVRRLVAARRRTLRGVLFTMKLNDRKTAAAIPSLIARVAGMGMTRVRATQLPSNRQEIFVYGQA